MGPLKAIGAAAAALMLGASMSMPALGQRYSSSYSYDRPAPRYDGDGKKIAPKSQPRHNRKRLSPEWRRYADAVVETHSDRDDPRDGKYLHSHARWGRALRQQLAAAGR